MFKEYWQNYRKYCQVAKPSKFLLSVYFVCTLACNACHTAKPFVASLIIGALMDQDANATYFYIIIYCFVLLGYRLADFATWRLYSVEAGRDYLNLHKKVFNKIISIDSNFTHDVKKGRFMNTVNSDIFNISEIGTYTIELFIETLQLPVILIIVGSYNVFFAVLIFISMILYFTVCDRSDRKFNILWEKKREEDDNYSNLISQVADGLQEVKAFNMLPRLYKKLNIIQKRYNAYYKKERYYRRVWKLDSKFIFYGFQTLLYLILTISLINGKIELNVLIMIIAYHDSVIKSYAGEMLDYIDEIRTRCISLKRIENILNYTPKERIKFGRTSIENLRGEIEFKNTTLKIGQKKIIDNFSLKIKPHEVIAIVGPPGAGKTMILDMLLRLQHPTKGKIFLDDINIDEFSREIYTSSVAVANQTPFVFNISIRDNLSFADANIKAQIKACKTVGIHDFIETLPQGYNTILRENASNVSGGQKQMISIARTILTDAEVLLLDDITTSLDPDTATFIPKLIERLKKEHTVIMVTKKPELMATADRIVVLRQGKIDAIGSHKTLIKKNKIYRMLQFASSNRRSPNA
ncbi:ABC transporter ATP-binding protein [Candidatus Saccharibacteria bacterium]|nr:ABC transporter ATP-binding protein [Candidatus Saccharibacteria bacterium]MBR3144037.1 ABC transporter ATP-binding protein [Candidatus Saccharibacteria bacterium]